MPDPNLLQTFRFQVKLRRSPTRAAGGQVPGGTPTGQSLGDGGFQECSGLQIEMDVQEYREGGRNNGTIRRVGYAKYANLVLKRGMFYGTGGVNSELWNWLDSIVTGQVPVLRYDGIIEVMSVRDRVAATWTFDRALPALVKGPELNAKTGEIAIEELHLAHEGLRLVNS